MKGQLQFTGRVVVISLALLYFTLPHTLEDFAVGEPAQAGVPAPVISLVVATIFGLQALGLYWLGQGRRRGLWAHLFVGAFWPLAAGAAQLPAILGGAPYRAGFISILYVVGIIGAGILLFTVTLQALRRASKAAGGSRPGQAG